MVIQQHRDKRFNPISRPPLYPPELLLRVSTLSVSEFTQTRAQPFRMFTSTSQLGHRRGSAVRWKFLFLFHLNSDAACVIYEVCDLITKRERRRELPQQRSVKTALRAAVLAANRCYYKDE